MTSDNTVSTVSTASEPSTPSAPVDRGTAGASRKLTARGAERRQELMEFAVVQFAKKGFHPTSVAEIVEGVGVGKGVFYWYFASKDELLLEILQQTLIDLRKHQQHAIRDTENPLLRIELGIRSSMEWLTARPDLLRLVMFAWTEERFAAALRKGRRIAIADTARHISEAMDKELIPEGDPTMLATAIRGVVDELARASASGSKPPDPVAVDTAVQICLYGLSGPS